jgi:hypothetical protein
VGKDVGNAQVLATSIKGIIGDVPLSDAKVGNLIAFATGEGKPVYFGAPAFAKFVDGPFADTSSTKLHEALVSSSAIPHFIKAPTTINFTMPGGGVKNIPNLIDGVFATAKGTFDPSAIYYDVFAKMFRDEELLIVYVGNGAPVDSAFRRGLGSKYGYKNKISQQTLTNGKKITFVSIEPEIVDDDGKSLFNVSGFYANADLEKYMDKAGDSAVSSPAYKWALDAMKAARGADQ